jgi:hypothetical protein
VADLEGGRRGWLLPCRAAKEKELSKTAIKLAQIHVKTIKTHHFFLKKHNGSKTYANSCQQPEKSLICFFKNVLMLENWRKFM